MNKKALIMFKRLSGGAPLSLLNYCKILQKNGYDVQILGEKKDDGIIKKYTEIGSKIIFIKAVNNRSVFGISKLRFYTFKNILSNKYDLIISVGDGDIFWNSYITEYANIPHIAMIPGGKVNINDYRINYWKYDKLICFSEENKTNLILTGINKEDIKVISNRIPILKVENDWLAHYSNLTTKRSINFLVVSRLDDDKVNSILNVMSLTEWLNDEGINVNLRIVGDGSNIQDILRYAEKINTKRNKNKEIVTLLGYKEELKEEFLRAHFVFGKGRSVIEPMLMKRAGVIIGEDNKMSIMTKESFENLYYYNFSGRNISNETTWYDIKDILISYSVNEFSKLFDEIYEKLKDKYDSDMLSGKVVDILNDFGEKKYNSKSFKISLLIRAVVTFYVTGIGNLLLRVKERVLK